VMEALRTLATTYRSKAIPRALGYVETHAHRMRYVTLERLKLPSMLPLLSSPFCTFFSLLFSFFKGLRHRGNTWPSQMPIGLIRAYMPYGNCLQV
jgi:hypothetical protein